MNNKILDLIYDTHTEGVEKTVFMQDFILKYDRANFCEDTADTLDFFYKHIPLHFAYEETVINELLKSRALTKDERACLDSILEEHKVLTASFEKIKAMAGEISKGDNKLREQFMSLVNETIYTLIKHAEYEDKYLFPLADAKADESMLRVVEKEI